MKLCFQVNSNEKNYLSLDNQASGKKTYRQWEPYAWNLEEKSITSIYMQLPEEYAVFSEIDNKYFFLDDTEQHRLLSMCLKHLKTQLVNLYVKFDITRILPKLSITFDEDKAIVLNWTHTNFRVYFNFEVVADSSYYGIVAQNNEGGIFTNSGRLDTENYNLVMNNILQYVIENSSIEGRMSWKQETSRQIFIEE